MIPLLAFAGTVTLCLFLTGNLSKEKIEKIIGKKNEQEVAPVAPGDVTDPYVRALKQREDELAKREARVQEEDERVKKSQADLEKLRADIETIQKEIGDTLAVEDSDQQKRVADVALSLSKMKPMNAAKTLDTWDVKESSKVLLLIKEKERGKILDAMTPEKAAAILLDLQSSKL
jgi:flagellar motility protein MotE (MotC chaperone)